MCSPINSKISNVPMNLLARFLVCIFLCKMCHLLLKLHIYAMQKLLWQSQILINRRISKCIRTLKHLHPLAAIVLITSITYTLFGKSGTVFAKVTFFFFFLLHSLCQLNSARKIFTFLLFYFLQAASLNCVPWGKVRL